ncbi:H-NS family nucleoid-associated regulatory protein [Salipiger abyssi]|uniref:H-NS histone family protein n=1 Tax=Salipiger abyssi TaxID=1250539 RepID=UPI001A8F66D0|nr:H-NS histone family protein [Salipiger abyssi]MBN9890142.1 H-NS histone family protein [Salipiger abyssi]
MIELDLNAMSREELKALQKDIDKALQSFEARQKAAARAAAEAVAREAGYSLQELLDAPKPGKQSAPPKYRHPENPEVTWSGRGRKPGWFVAALDSGKSEDDLLIG